MSSRYSEGGKNAWTAGYVLSQPIYNSMDPKDWPSEWYWESLNDGRNHALLDKYAADHQKQEAENHKRIREKFKAIRAAHALKK